MKGSQYIAKTWLAYGVKDIFLVPTNLFDSLVELEGTGVRRILTHGEKAAGYMADGYAQASGRPGIVITQGGPGATNLAAGLAEPWQGSTPVIAFTGARSGAQSYKNAYQDVTPHFESVTKYDVEVARTDRLPDLLAQAFREATAGDPRPVHLAIPPLRLLSGDPHRAVRGGRGSGGRAAPACGAAGDHRRRRRDQVGGVA
jgi:acetolactate synthase-1/2/3 large subunit